MISKSMYDIAYFYWWIYEFDSLTPKFIQYLKNNFFTESVKDLVIFIESERKHFDFASALKPLIEILVDRLNTSNKNNRNTLDHFEFVLNRICALDDVQLMTSLCEVWSAKKDTNKQLYRELFTLESVQLTIKSDLESKTPVQKKIEDRINLLSLPKPQFYTSFEFPKADYPSDPMIQRFLRENSEFFTYVEVEDNEVEVYESKSVKFKKDLTYKNKK